MKKIINLFTTIIFMSFAIGGCAPVQSGQAVLPLEIQAIQKKEFETTKRIAFGSVVSVLQDLGYIINNADFETGIITGNSPTNDNVALRIFIGVSQNTTTKVSAFIEELSGGIVSIRLNFVANTTQSSAYGQNSSSDLPILDQEVYMSAFNKIEDAIFIRS